jgi:hypothetical protein
VPSDEEHQNKSGICAILIRDHFQKSSYYFLEMS